MTGAERLRAWRGDRTQEEAAVLLGIKQYTVARLEGRGKPSIETALAIASATEGAVPVDAWVAPDDSASLRVVAAKSTDPHTG